MSVKGKTYLVTGGTGFIGRALVGALVKKGAKVRSLDNDSRGSQESLGKLSKEIELMSGDIRDLATVRRAVKGVDGVVHLAFINGTEYFYSIPQRVLEVAVKGIMNVVDACLEHGVQELSVASSSEVYQTPPAIPTAEDVPLSVPDPSNPRYSYGGGKIITELVAMNYGRANFERVTVFRPHNVYGPNMGWEHVVPQFVARLKELIAKQPQGVIDFPIQGTGAETRAFCAINDAADGILRVIDEGTHLGIYHVGTDVETPIADLAHQVAKVIGREINIVPGPLREGGTMRRCPDITKLRALGYTPRVSLAEGLKKTVDWYMKNEAPPSKVEAKG